MEKVAPSERFRRELDEVLAGVGGEENPIETIGRLGVRLILQQAPEDEVTGFLGRRRYERAGETVSYRNSHEPTTVKTTSGAMRLERPGSVMLHRKRTRTTNLLERTFVEVRRTPTSSAGSPERPQSSPSSGPSLSSRAAGSAA